MAIQIGANAKFKGYTELETGQTPILVAGEEVEIVGYDPAEDSYVVTATDGSKRTDTLFGEEVEEIVAPVDEVAPAAAAAPKRRSKAAAAAPLVIVESLKDQLGSKQMALDTALRLATQLTELREQEEQTVFSIGGTLAYIKETEAFKDAGFADMDAYVEGALGLKERSAQYYVKVYVELTAAGVTSKDIEGLGWTKLRALTGVIDKTNKAALLKKAKTLTRDALVDHVREIKLKGKASADTTKGPALVKVPAFKLHADQGTAFEAAISRAKLAYEVDNQGEALFLMSQEWLQGQNVVIPIEQALAILNARYGTDFAVEDETAPAGQTAAA